MERSSQQAQQQGRRTAPSSAEVRIQIDGCSRASSSNQNRSSDGTEVAVDGIWSRGADISQPPKKSINVFPKKRVDKLRPAPRLSSPLQNSHNFLTEATDMRSMESALKNLVNDFHSGKLQAFGRHCSTEQMEAIRDQQEKLARLHFELGAQHDVTPRTSEHMNQLVSALEHLSQTIEQLHPDATQCRNDSNEES